MAFDHTGKAPGVYIEELASGVRLITGVETSIPCFIGNVAQNIPDVDATKPLRIRNWRELAERLPPLPAPTGLMAEPPTSSSVTLSWDEVPGATGYIVYQSNNKVQSVTEKNVTIRGLSPSTQYAFQVSATNGKGHSAKSDAVSTTTLADLGVNDLGVPANLTATGTPSSVTLSWDEVPDATGYIVYQDNNKVQSVTEKNVTIRKLKPSTQYAFQVSATKDDGESGRSQENVITTTSGASKGGSNEKPTRQLSQDSSPSYLLDAVYGHFMNGGGPCYLFDIGGPPTDAAALAPLKSVPEIKILVAPDLWAGTDVEAKSFAQAMANHCHDMGTRMALLHTQKELSVDAALEASNLGLTDDAAPFTALYYPWVTAVRYNGEQGPVPPSGHIAGVWGRVDNSRGVHKAPANEALQGVVDLEKVLTDEEQGRLNEQGVNCLRTFPGRGIRVWGARTLSDTSDWKYINVRRLLNYLGESVKLGTNWAVFEPNNDQLWSSLRRNITFFLMDLWRQGALLGRTPDEAFYVICDESNNPPESITAGKVICDIGVAAVRPAEFVAFQVMQIIGTPQEG